MQKFTRYLSVNSVNDGQFRVAITNESPHIFLNNTLSKDLELRYSPIFPAYLEPGKGPPPIPDKLTSVAFFFSRRPYNALGLMKPELNAAELEQVYFTQGLASILCLNCDLSRAIELRERISPKLLEYWPLADTLIYTNQVVIESDMDENDHPSEIALKKKPVKDLEIYVEQILACIITLQKSYSIYNPDEILTLDRILQLTDKCIEQYYKISNRRASDDNKTFLDNVKKCNSIKSAFSELSASLSYAVTQGTSGCSPILANRSPFPHLSLLGIGGSVRAITKFIRYLEIAFEVRDVSSVIEKGYSCREINIPIKISDYSSGAEYKFSNADESSINEEFDQGGEFRQVENIPLTAYFSTRHGFKETKFTLTVAAESLTDEVSPQWTIMTLSHEIMHARVREIFQTLFGSSWDQDRTSLLTQQHHMDFRDWYANRQKKKPHKLDCAIRNVILNFCCAMDCAKNIRKKSEQYDKHEISEISEQDLIESYRRHKLYAVELFVHFHDYYFAYACQPAMYIMSLWASWIEVAAPYSRPLDYLIRTLATVACGTGSEPQTAFEYAKEQFEDALNSLERLDIRSPLFTQLLSLLDEQMTYALFKPSYYLIDQARRFFASREIASRIDRIEDDPFAEGSTLVDDYSANVFVYGENNRKSNISPIRYSLASFLRSMCGHQPIMDTRWLTAWNAIVISSQEVTNDNA